MVGNPMYSIFPSAETGISPAHKEKRQLAMIVKLLKAAEVAEILGVSRTQAYRLMQMGEIPSVRFGQRTVRVRPEDLKRYIETHTQCQEEEKGKGQFIRGRMDPGVPR